MPPLSQVRTPGLDALARHLADLPEAQAAAERAEALAGEVEAGREYPLEWVAFRVAGRPASDQPAALGALLAGDGAGPVVMGAMLLADLSAMVERLTAAGAGVPPPGAFDADALAARWGVSRRTIDRLRRRGLVARRTIGPLGRPTLAFTPAVVERFEAAHGESLAAAGGFSRMPPGEAARIADRGRKYARVGLSLNEAARRLAARHGRSHETIRQLLRRSDASAVAPVFGVPATPASKRRRVAYRAWRRGIEPAALAERTGRGRASVVRLINDHRAAVLRALRLPPHAEPDVKRGESGSRRWLSPAPVRTELGAPGQTDLISLIDAARRPEVPIGIVESTRAAAYHFLLGEASRLIAAIPAKGGHPTEIDRAETMLRWAARLKAELVRAQLGLMVRTIEAQLGTPVDHLRAADAGEVLGRGLTAVASAVDAFDPFKKSGRLAAPTGLAVNRAASRWVREHRPDPDKAVRATPRLRMGAPIADWTLTIAGWQRVLEPDRRIRAAAMGGADGLPERERLFLLERFGWGGGPPRTLAAMADGLGLTPMRVAQRERLAVRAALGAWRAHKKGATAAPGAN